MNLRFKRLTAREESQLEWRFNRSLRCDPFTGAPSGQVFIEVMLWSMLSFGLVLALSRGFRHDFLLYRALLEKESGYPRVERFRLFSI